MHNKDFVDLEILLNKVRDIEIRQYVEESIGCYYARSYRATIITIWIATVLDLYKKIESIYSIFNDNGAKIILNKIEACKNNNKASEWEKTILSDAKDIVKIINQEQYERLKRIEEDRHKCAHPVTDDDGILYLPTAEEARAHIRNAIEILLSQNAIFGKNFADNIIKQLQGPYVGDEKESIQTQLSKYLKNSNDIFRKNLIKLLLKKIIYLDISETQAFWLKYANCICILKEIYEKDFYEQNEKIAEIFSRVTDLHVPYLIKLLAVNPFLAEFLQDSVKDKIEQYTELDSTIETKLQTISYSEKNFDYIIDNFMAFPTWISGQGYYNPSQQILTLKYINRFNLIDTEKFKELKELAITTFLNSTDLNSADKHEAGMEVLKKYLTKEEIEKLLDEAPNNHSSQYGSNQLVKSVYLFKRLFNESIAKYPELLPKWKNFAKLDFLQDNEILVDTIKSINLV